MVSGSRGRLPSADLPVSFTGGIAGKQLGCKPFPRYTLHLLGRYTITPECLRWVPLAPWRHPKLVEVQWSAVRVISSDPAFMVSAEGWERLTLGPDRPRLFLAALKSVGLVLHYSTAWRRYVALWPGTEPDWSRGGPPATTGQWWD